MQISLKQPPVILIVFKNAQSIIFIGFLLCDGIGGEFERGGGSGKEKKEKKIESVKGRKRTGE